MPDLAAFARRIRAIGKQVETRADEVTRETAIAIDQAVVLATPVDTGRARGNWRVGIGSPLTDVLEQEDESGQATINRNNARIRARRPRQTIFISNNVPYIGSLNAGSSSQAPANFIEMAVLTGANFVRRARLTRR